MEEYSPRQHSLEQQRQLQRQQQITQEVGSIAVSSTEHHDFFTKSWEPQPFSD